MRQLDQQLILHVGDGVAVRQQQGAAAGAQQREHEARPGLDTAAGAHAPFEDRERSDQHDEHPVLQYFDVAEADKEADVAEGPDLGIGAQEQKAGKAQEQQRPVPRPAQTGGIQQ